MAVENLQGRRFELAIHPPDDVIFFKKQRDRTPLLHSVSVIPDLRKALIRFDEKAFTSKVPCRNPKLPCKAIEVHAVDMLYLPGGKFIDAVPASAVIAGHPNRNCGSVAVVTVLSGVDCPIRRDTNAAVQDIAALKQPARSLTGAGAEIASIDISTVKSNDGRSVSREDSIHFIQA
jgi:hypothetical protein